MNQIACVESQFIVPGVIYAEGKLRHPFRIYSNAKGDVCVLVCEAPIMIEGMYSVLDAVMNWALHNKVNEVVVLDGIAVEGLPDPKRTAIILSSDGRQADAANLIHENENNIDVKNKKQEIADDIDGFCRRYGRRNFIFLSIKWYCFEGSTPIFNKRDAGSGRSGHPNRIS
jgi:uncharacterized protein